MNVVKSASRNLTRTVFPLRSLRCRYSVISRASLKKVDHDYDPTDRDQAMALLHEAQDELHFYTGLIYYNADSIPFDEEMHLVDEPLSSLPTERLRPSNEVFAEIMDSFK